MIKFNYLLPFLVIYLIFGCKKDDDGVAYAYLTPSEADVIAQDTDYSISIYSNLVTWTFQQQTFESWVKIADGDIITCDTSRVLDFVLEPNVDTVDRVATFQLSYTNDSLVVYTFELTQLAQVKKINIEMDTIFVSPDAQSISNNIESNVEWEAEFNASWFREENTRVFSDKTLYMSVDENTNLNFRVGKVTLTQIGDTVTNKFYVFQNGLGDIASDSLVLVDLYNATKGSSWSKKWDLSKPLSDWNGVTVEYRNEIERVVAIDLSSNGLEGEIPASLGDLGYLDYLSLYDNKLSGEIPSDIGNLHEVKYIYLHKNDLTGEIPESIGELEYLNTLHLGYNMLSGTIPENLSNIEKFVVLGVEYNNLTGTLPTDLGSSSMLKYIFVQGNRLSGSIPSTYTKNVLWKTWNYPTNICPQQSGYGFDNCPE